MNFYETGDFKRDGYADLKSWQKHPAIIFVGTPTTVGDSERRVEAYLMDIPDQDYYGEKLVISPEHFHRANKKFATIEELVNEMHADERAARYWFVHICSTDQ